MMNFKITPLLKDKWPPSLIIRKLSSQGRAIKKNIVPFNSQIKDAWNQ